MQQINIRMVRCETDTGFMVITTITEGREISMGSVYPVIKGSQPDVWLNCHKVHLNI